MNLSACFAPARWEQIERDYSAWWAHELERPLVQIVQTERDPAIAYPEIEKFTSNYPFEMPAEEVVEQITLDLMSRRYYGDAFPRWWVNFGPGTLTRFTRIT